MSSREAFEAWVDSNFPFKKDRFDLFRGEYKSQFTKQLWQSWQASREGLDAKLKSAENNDVDARCHVAELEAKCAALAAELSAVETIHNDAVFITDEHYEQCPPEVQKMIRSLAVLQIPAYQAFLAEVRAHDLNAFIRHHSAELDAHIKNGGEQFDEKSVRIRDIIVSARLFREQIRKEAAQ
ncbi:MULTISPECIES: hypothetical protein [Enterobacter cloacae complex]|jgi:hypothetical protein|uniref:hypothetical protein n=1 Tax=Enterobacter cloacae complex TaxID=354276 RepID=UPI000B24956D|nr:hypothetical protein [Enterobacter hormaechei]MCU3671677.1 hypothetical protein [Enterobacter hormaechei subsp. oharae]WMA23119.1 hypothetical protein QPR56_10060 [Enterobacter hormaechei]VAM12273.1 Uncharacterised protein [Enterobacter hormaechei]DAI81524.1 MAG TPA: hypothetical protein [Caudoviricetes sp.]